MTALGLHRTPDGLLCPRGHPAAEGVCHPDVIEQARLAIRADLEPHVGRAGLSAALADEIAVTLARAGVERFVTGGPGGPPQATGGT